MMLVVGCFPVEPKHFDSISESIFSRSEFSTPKQILKVCSRHHLSSNFPPPSSTSTLTSTSTTHHPCPHSHSESETEVQTSIPPRHHHHYYYCQDENENENENESEKDFIYHFPPSPHRRYLCHSQLTFSPPPPPYPVNQLWYINFMSHVSVYIYEKREREKKLRRRMTMTPSTSKLKLSQCSLL